jgi:hypothetical protein
MYIIGLSNTWIGNRERLRSSNRHVNLITVPTNDLARVFTVTLNSTYLAMKLEVA